MKRKKWLLFLKSGNSTKLPTEGAGAQFTDLKNLNSF